MTRNSGKKKLNRKAGGRSKVHFAEHLILGPHHVATLKLMFKNFKHFNSLKKSRKEPHKRSQGTQKSIILTGQSQYYSRHLPLPICRAGPQLYSLEQRRLTSLISSTRRRRNDVSSRSPHELL